MKKVTLESLKRVNGNKIQFQFAQEITKTGTSTVNTVALLNSNDERFAQSKARKAWITADMVNASNISGISVEKLEALNVGDEIDLNIENPSFNGMLFQVRVIETTTPTEWQSANLEKAAKRAGKDGEFLTHDGYYIFSNTRVELLPEGVEAEHIFLSHDQEFTSNSGEGIKATTETEMSL